MNKEGHAGHPLQVSIGGVAHFTDLPQFCTHPGWPGEPGRAAPPGAAGDGVRRRLSAMRAGGAPPASLPLDWPHRAFSHAIGVGSLNWHVQVGHAGPVVLLLHGTGASAHSFAELIERLGGAVTVIAPDLPGHGFTVGAKPPELTLPAIATALDALLDELQVERVALVAGHSAGAALALRWQLQTRRPVGAVVGFNPALIAPPQAYRSVFGPLIAPVASSSLVARALTTLGEYTPLVDRLLDGTGSTVSAAQRRRYATLFRRASHVQGALGLMAAADLPDLLEACRARALAPTFVVGSRDRWLPEARLIRVIADYLPHSTVIRAQAGHLFHEEDAAAAAAILLERVPGTSAAQAQSP